MRAETGVKALKILGIEEAAIANNDLVIFLYAVGLVRDILAATRAVRRCITPLSVRPVHGQHKPRRHACMGHASLSQDMRLIPPCPMQNPTDDVIDSKLRAFKLHDSEHYTFGEVCHMWWVGWLDGVVWCGA